MCHYGNIINFRSYRKRALQSNLIIAHGFLVQEEETVMQLLEYFIFCSAAANERHPDGRFSSESLLMKRKPNLQPQEGPPHSSASPVRLLTAARPPPQPPMGGAPTPPSSWEPSRGLKEGQTRELKDTTAQLHQEMKASSLENEMKNIFSILYNYSVFFFSPLNLRNQDHLSKT